MFCLMSAKERQACYFTFHDLNLVRRIMLKKNIAPGKTVHSSLLNRQFILKPKEEQIEKRKCRMMNVKVF